MDRTEITELITSRQAKSFARLLQCLLAHRGQRNDMIAKITEPKLFDADVLTPVGMIPETKLKKISV